MNEIFFTQQSGFAFVMTEIRNIPYLCKLNLLINVKKNDLTEMFKVHNVTINEIYEGVIVEDDSLMAFDVHEDLNYLIRLKSKEERIINVNLRLNTLLNLSLNNEKIRLNKNGTFFILKS